MRSAVCGGAEPGSRVAGLENAHRVVPRAPCGGTGRLRIFPDRCRRPRRHGSARERFEALAVACSRRISLGWDGDSGRRGERRSPDSGDLQSGVFDASISGFADRPRSTVHRGSCSARAEFRPRESSDLEPYRINWSRADHDAPPMTLTNARRPDASGPAELDNHRHPVMTPRRPSGEPSPT